MLSDPAPSQFVVLEGAIQQPLLAELRAAVAPLLARHAELHREGDQPHWDLEEDADGRSSPSAQRLQTIMEPGWFDPALLGFLNLEATNRAAADITGCEDPAQLSAAGLAILLGHAEEHCLAFHRGNRSSSRCVAS